MKNTEISNSFIVATTGVSILQTAYLKEYNPDIKRKEFDPSAVSEWSIYNNTLVRYDDYGNILFGAAGTAFGISTRDLFFGANINQILKSGLDESKDTHSIQRGIALYNNSLARKQV